MTTLRTAHALDSLQIGGTEWQCVSLAKGLEPARFGSVVLLLGPEGPLLEHLSQAGVPCERLPLDGFRRPSGWKNILDLARWFRRHRIQVAQAYGFYSNVPALLAASIARVPVRIASRRDMGEFLTPGQRAVERWVFRLAHRVIVNAHAIANELAEHGQAPRSKITVIPTGVDLARFDEPAADRVWPWSDRRKVIVMIGKFRRQKDQATLLHAAARVLVEEPEAVFVLGGDGYLLPDHETLAREIGIAGSVRFVGRVEPSEVPALIRSGSICAMISKGNEGTPNSVLEAMAAARVVVATDTGGCREAITDGVSGFLTAPGDVEQVARRLLELLRDPARAAAMGLAGRKRIEEQFSMSRMVLCFSELYETLARERGIA